MITSADFSKVVYRYPKLHSRGDEISTLLGLDTEAYDNGQPFMVCLSNGHTFGPEDIPGALFKHADKQHVAVYNLKYDSGAVLYYMPPEAKSELWEKTYTKWGPYSVEYIPHKYLSFAQGRAHWVKLWDVSQYFAMPLDRAAQRYLDKRKTDIETKKFSRAYVKKNRAKIRRYCMQDARLCAELGTFLVRKLQEFGIRATALYSSASLSFRYFSDRGRIVTSWRYWKYHRDILPVAIDSYEGGKFEVTARGAFTGYEYDLVSAYPYEIANLADITLARVEHTKRYRPDATYGYIRAKVHNPSGLHVPCGLMIDNVRVYPAGRFYVTITKGEFDYMIGLGLDVDILDAYWLHVDHLSYPYAEIVAELFALKAQYKGKDAMLYEVSKRMLNSFYGKTVQMIPDWRDRVVAGIGWQPMYGAVITANTRIAMCKVQNAFGPRCLAVHTDSVITTEELPAAQITEALGGFGFVDKGNGLLIACGQYEIGQQSAFKGFAPKRGDTWRRILTRHPRASHIRYPVLRVESWIEALSKGHPDKVNYFEETTKNIDLNGDTKRIWHERATGGRLLSHLAQSTPRIIIHSKTPEYWP